MVKRVSSAMKACMEVILNCAIWSHCGGSQLPLSKNIGLSKPRACVVGFYDHL